MQIYTPDEIEQGREVKHRLLLELENCKKQYGPRITKWGMIHADIEWTGKWCQELVDAKRKQDD